MLWLVHSSFLVAFVLIPKVHIRSSRVLSENRLFEISFSHWHDNQMGAMDKPQVILPFIYIYIYIYIQILWYYIHMSDSIPWCRHMSSFLPIFASKPQSWSGGVACARLASTTFSGSDDFAPGGGRFSGQEISSSKFHGICCFIFFLFFYSKGSTSCGF